MVGKWEERKQKRKQRGNRVSWEAWTGQCREPGLRYKHHCSAKALDMTPYGHTKAWIFKANFNLSGPNYHLSSRGVVESCVKFLLAYQLYFHQIFKKPYLINKKTVIVPYLQCLTSSNSSIITSLTADYLSQATGTCFSLLKLLKACFNFMS